MWTLRVVALVGEHQGNSLNNGHWLRHERVGAAWWTVSDAVVTSVSLATVLGKQASFLVYERVAVVPG